MMYDEYLPTLLILTTCRELLAYSESRNHATEATDMEVG